MTSTITAISTPPSASNTSAPASGLAQAVRPWHHVVLAVAAVSWATIALIHPMGGDGRVYDDMRSEVPLFIGIHLAQLVLSIALATGLWAALRGLRSPAARIARGSIVVYLAFFGAFDAIVGISTALVAHHANSSTGATREGAIDTLEYLAWNPIAGNTGIVWAVATIALVGAILGTGSALRRSGARRAIWVPMFVGVLLASHAGPTAAIGVVALAVALHLHLRDSDQS